MYFNLVFDRFQSNRPYPNLAPWVDITQGYSKLWAMEPYVIPTRLLYYVDNHDYPSRYFLTSDNFPINSWYPIAIAFYNFEIDYFALLSVEVKKLLQNKKLRILFYYHEGDNPKRQLEDLDQKCRNNQLPSDCWKFVTGNNAAQQVRQFAYFPDHEMFYWKANRQHAPLPIDNLDRPYDFTMLIRTHKWWRATVAADLKNLGILDQSIWSYGNETTDDDFLDNPIELDSIAGLRKNLEDFMQHTPYRCDTLSSTAHNTHHVLVPEHFTQSYVHIVCETFFDVDQSNGAFLTEKVFKPIKHGQPFVCIGPSGSLQLLRNLGYRTFDNVFDNSYDSITDNTQRWHCLRTLLINLKKQELKKIFEKCRDDIIHNQLHFVSSKHNRLKLLQEHLNAS